MLQRCSARLRADCGHGDHRAYRFDATCRLLHRRCYQRTHRHTARHGRTDPDANAHQLPHEHTKRDGDGYSRRDHSDSR
ncbi:hypothetical protein GCM10027568_01320 [Humibacter soli]